MKRATKYLKIFGVSSILILLSLTTYAFSFKFNIMGYDISYNPTQEQQVINEIDKKQENKDIPMSRGDTYEVLKTQAIEPIQIHEFDKDIENLNSIPEVIKTLGDLGYSQIAFTDTDKNERYVFVISSQGVITSVYKNNLMYAEVETRGSLQKIKDYAYRKDFERLKLTVEVPFSVKLRLLVKQWWN